MLRRALYLLPVVVFTVVVGYFLWGLSAVRDPHAVPSALIDKPVPQFDLPAISGLGRPGLSTADLGDGKVVLVNFFASWCVPCRYEHPLLVDLAKTSGITLYGVNYRDEAADARRWLGQLGDPYKRVGSDRQGRTAIDFGASGVPETFVVDRAGRIRYQQIGPLSPQDLEHRILPLVEELSR